MRLCSKGCGYETISPRHPLCPWHRHLRTSMDDQIRAATERREKALADGAEPRARVPERDWPAGERWCAGCQSFVPKWYCTVSQCKACAANARRQSTRASTYGLDNDGFEALMDLQDGRCAICRNRQRDRSLAVDHDHKTGAVRGGLCYEDNHKLLGAAHESPRRLLAALVYLLAPPASGRWLDPEVHGDRVMTAVLNALQEPVGAEAEECGEAGQREPGQDLPPELGGS